MRRKKNIHVQHITMYNTLEKPLVFIFDLAIYPEKKKEILNNKKSETCSHYYSICLESLLYIFSIKTYIIIYCW